MPYDVKHNQMIYRLYFRNHWRIYFGSMEFDFSAEIRELRLQL